MSKYLSKVAGTIVQSSRAAWNDVRLNWLGQTWPVKPITLNLLVNDICNSHCQMCLIWERKRDKEINAVELSAILRDPLFGRLKYVGVSGGEPTLRNDLPELFGVLANKRPTLSGAGIITNAIQADAVIERVTDCAKICEKAEIRFNVMVSLDGVGQVHDHVRGRTGNFDSAMRVIDHLRLHTQIPVIFGCTITKDNVWHVDELLDFAQENQLYGRFRVAEYIQRLYNENQSQYIRNFTPEECYHLALFFTRLEREFEKSPIYQRTYRNLRAMLFEGAPRTIRCPYQTNAVVLDSRGQLLYCSPKSPVIGNTLSERPIDIYNNNIDVRRKIIEHDCSQCIHDYHADATIDELLQRLNKVRWQRSMRPQAVLRTSLQPSPSNSSLNTPQHAFIVGWYGTETAGDKAILGQIIYRLKEEGVKHITLASLTPFLTRWTIQELKYPDIDIIPTFSSNYLRTAASADIIIMGGGPLMDLAALGPVLHAFSTARKNKKLTWIAGCGIGPLKNPLYIASVIKLLHLSTRIELRDTDSVNWAIQHTNRTDILNTGDPAIGYVKRWQASRVSITTRQPTLNCYLREWSDEYIGKLTPAEFQAQKLLFEQNLCRWISTISKRFGLRPRLLPMHHFSIGGDDREFNRRLVHQYLAHLDPIVEIRPLTVNQILESIIEASYCLTMRFHSTLFAYTLQAPFTAIDYTSGGKVYRFLADRNALAHLATLAQIINQTPPPISIAHEDSPHKYQ